ncbi:MAG: hypothetical protein ACYC35_16835 [Pirellulales bacterium]
MFLLLAFYFPSPLRAQSRGKQPAARPAAAARAADFRSAHFLIHTDLPPDDAKKLLDELETMLGLISNYWGSPSSGILECYLVGDLANWPEGSLDPAGRAKIAAGAGTTMTQTMRSGNLFRAKAVVYAKAERGTALHEAVHAYCGQAFGRTGPVWYAEGMAEMGNYWREGDRAVNCAPPVVEYLRGNKPKSLDAIVNNREHTGDSWQNYAWRWALCHMLANNTNYAPKFRPLGLGLLNGQKVSFEQVYGSVADQISFEYLFFLEHLDRGYRVDLCSWNWKAKFRALQGGSPITAVVQAAQGWQPSGARVAAGKEYDFSVSGSWRTAKGGEPVNADGAADGRGRLVGIVMKDYTLGKAFDLGSYGSFTAPGDGLLYLRCQDAWNELADNQGKVTVKLKVKGQGPALARPKETP